MTKNGLILEIIRLEYGEKAEHDYGLFKMRFNSLRPLKKIVLEDRVKYLTEKKGKRKLL